MSTALLTTAGASNMKTVIEEWKSSPPFAFDDKLRELYTKTLDDLLVELEAKIHNREYLKKLHTTLSIFSELQTKVTDLQKKLISNSTINPNDVDEITKLQNQLNDSMLSQNQKIKRFFWTLGSIVIGFAAGLVAGAACGALGCIGGALMSIGGLSFSATPAGWITAGIITGIAALAFGCGFACYLGHSTYEKKTNEYSSTSKTNLSQFFTKATVDIQKQEVKSKKAPDGDATSMEETPSPL